MRNIRATGCGVMLASALLAFGAADGAQRTFVASYGNNLNTCSLGSPCRDFATAMAQTDLGGEIIVLDSAGYGKVVIDRSVAIVAAPGIYAGISVFSGSGVFIDAPGAKVTLRGLTINGQGGTYGVYFNQGARLHVDGCVVSGLVTGILTYGGDATVQDTTIRDHSQRGVDVQNGSLSVQLDRVRIQHNGLQGMNVQLSSGGVRVSVRDSTITDNGREGVWINATSGSALAAVDVESSEIASNGWTTSSSGVSVYAASGSIAELSLARSLVVRNNGNGINVASGGGAARASITDNTITGNYANGVYSAGSGTTVLATRNTVTLNSDFGFFNFNSTFYSGGDSRAMLNFAAPSSGTITVLGGL